MGARLLFAPFITLKEENNMTQSLFPEGFLWGGALSACQAEGAYNVDGKSLTIPEVMKFNANNDRKVTKQMKINREMIEEAKNDPDTVKYPKRRGIDFYHTFREDIALLPKWASKCSVIPLHGRVYSLTEMMQHQTKRLCNSMIKSSTSA